MANPDPVDAQFYRADINHDGGVDQNEFRQFIASGESASRQLEVAPADIIRRLSQGSIVTESITYPIGLDVGVAGFTAHPENYEKYAGAIGPTERHGYGVGPDVAVGAPNLAQQNVQYDAAGSMFNYADVNHDGKVDRAEFGSFMHSI